jgi:ABC-type uncharacterized transport system involved in gliding motility auxiliary subunit
MATESQKRTAAAQTGLYLIVVTAIVVVANLLGAGSYVRKDMTKNDRFTLSQGSGRLVRSLKEPVQVDVYVKTGLAQLDAFVRDLKNLLDEYEINGGGKFKYTIIEPDTDELKEQAREAGVQEQPFGEETKKGDGASITQGFLGLVLKYGSEKGVIPALHPARGDGLEFFITNKIREIRDKNDDIKHRIGVITGKDELQLTDTNLVPSQGQQGGQNLQQIITQNFPFYSIETVDLGGGESEIDPEFAGLIMTQPGQDYTEKELRRIDAFLMQGGKALTVIASAVNLKANEPSMNAELNLHGMDQLLTGYGIEMHKDAVLDHGAQFRIPVVTQLGRMQWQRHPGIAHVINDPRFTDDEARLDSSFPGFFRMEELMLPFPSSLSLLRDKQPADVKLKAVLRTTPASSLETSETVDMSLRANWEPRPPFDQHIIAAEAEGPLKSAFAGKPGEGIEAPETAKSPSRVLVIASSQFITNPFARAGNPAPTPPQMQQFGSPPGDRDLLSIAQPYVNNYMTGTILALKNTLDWMSGDVDLIATSSKILGEANLTYSSVEKPTFKAGETDEDVRKKDEEYRMARQKLQNKVQWTLTLGLPLFFALLGLWRYQVRGKRRDTPVRRARSQDEVRRDTKKAA